MWCLPRAHRLLRKGHGRWPRSALHPNNLHFQLELIDYSRGIGARHEIKYKASHSFAGGCKGLAASSLWVQPPLLQTPNLTAEFGPRYKWRAQENFRSLSICGGSHATRWQSKNWNRAARKIVAAKRVEKRWPVLQRSQPARRQRR